jgi:hypothetical protein
MMLVQHGVFSHELARIRVAVKLISGFLNAAAMFAFGTMPADPSFVICNSY